MLQIIRLETTNICNLQCRMCPQSIQRPGVSRGFMKAALFDRIVGQLAAFEETKKAHFYLHICGEPLLHPYLVELVASAAGHGFSPTLTTNATRLRPELAHRLVRAGLRRIEFSFEGVDAATYEAVRQGADYEQVLRNIQSFLALNEELGHPVHTELVVVDLPQVEASRLRDFCTRMQGLFDHVNLAGYFDWQGRMEADPFDRLQYVGCPALVSDLNVLWDGRVVPCCMDIDGAMTIGDFNCQSFLEVMAAAQRRQLGARLQAGCLSGLPCERCVVPWAGRQVRRPKADEPCAMVV